MNLSPGSFLQLTACPDRAHYSSGMCRIACAGGDNASKRRVDGGEVSRSCDAHVIDGISARRLQMTAQWGQPSEEMQQGTKSKREISYRRTISIKQQRSYKEESISIAVQ